MYFPAGPTRQAVVPVFALILVLASGTPAAAPPGLGSGHRQAIYPPHVPGEILVKFKSGAGPSEQTHARAMVGGARLRKFRGGAEHWKTGPGVSTEEAIARLQGNPHVEYVEPNYLVTADATPDDPSYPQCWGLHNTGQTGGTAGSDIDAEAAWDLTTGSRNVLVGVIDTGIDYTHPDLAANIWTNPGEIPNNSIDDDHNGFVDDVRGWDFVNNDNDPFDDHFHGTHVAGTIGAVGNNGIGVAGVNWQVSLVPLKFLNAGGSGTTADAIRAVNYATLMHLDMTSNSWGGGGFSQALLDAINGAGAANLLFVAAAGNNSGNNDLSPHYPSSYDAPSIVSVAATDDRDRLASFSNYGATTVDLGAPGVLVFSTAPARSYLYLSGTSMATPHVAGVAAMLRAVSPGIPVTALKQALLDSAERIPSLAGITVSGGRLNAARALATLDSIPPDPITDLAASAPTSGSITLMWTATGDNGSAGTAAYYDVRYATSPLDESSFASAARATGAPFPQPPGAAETMEVTGLTASTTYYFAVKAVDDGGNAGPISNLATQTTLPPPTFSSTPPSFSVSLFTGQSTTRALTVGNVGDGTLDWSIPQPSVLGGVTAQQPSMTLAKGEADPRPGTPATEVAGGPDALGYRFIDSDEAGGPVFSWHDISGTGTTIATLTGDDVTSELIPLGFDFPFYGNTFNAVHVSSNGFLSFTSTSAAYTNQPLPNAGAPENLIAPFWDDLVIGSGARVVYARDAKSFTVQFIHLIPFIGSGTFDFEVILRDSGEILFQYLSMSGPVNQATVGIQNDTGSVGLQPVFNNSYLHDNLAIRFGFTPQWLSASPTQGRLYSGQQEEITVGIDADALAGGTYQSAVIVQTNDPLNPSVAHAVTLTVTDAPVAAVTPSTLDFGTVFLGFSSVLALTVSNSGTADLTADIASSDPAVTVTPSSLSLPPGGIQQVGVTFSALALGPFSSLITVESNAPNAPHIEVPVAVAVVPAPGIQVEPASYSESLLTGGTVTRNLRITNTGGSDLALNLMTELIPPSPPPAPAQAQSAPLPAIVNGGFESGSFQGWTASTNGLPETLPWSVRPAGGDFFGVSSPSEGTFYALNGFDGAAGLVYDLHQDVAVPAGTLRADLRFDDRIQFDSLGIGSTLPRIYEATIEDTGGSRLALIVHEEIALNGRPYTDLGWRHRTVSLAPFAGRTVRLHIHESIPESFTGPASLELDGFTIDAQGIPGWLNVAPASATVPPGASLDFAVTFDAGNSDTAVYTGAVRIETNIPNAPTVRVPAVLSVTGAPNIAVEGHPVTLESVQTYHGSGARTSHALAIGTPPAGGGTITLVADGDYGFPSETATATVEGLALGSVGGLSMVDCTPAQGDFPLTASDLAGLVADGVVNVDVQNSFGVDDFCSVNRHTVRLAYNGPADHLDFGTLFVGLTASRTLVLRNDGTDFLHISSIAAGLPEFTPSLASLTLPPRTSGTLAVSFTPSSPAGFSDALSIASDDPDTPLITIPLAGTGVLPPIVGVQPASLASTLFSGLTETQTLTLANTGGSPLNFGLTVRARTGPGGSCAPGAAVVSEWTAGTLSTVDLATGVVHRFATGLISPNKGMAVYAQATSVLVTESNADSVVSVDLATGAVRQIAFGFDFPNGLALNAAETTAFVTEGGTGDVTAVDVATGSRTMVATGFAAPNQIVLDAAGATAYVVDYGSGELSSVDVVTGAVRTIAVGLRGPAGIALDPSQTKAWVTEANLGTVSEVDLATGAVRPVATGLGAIESLAVDPAGTTAFVTQYDTGMLLAVDLSTGAFQTVASGLTTPVGVALVPPAGCTGKFLTVSPASGSVPVSGTLELQARFDTSGLIGGSYAADIKVTSNDPVTPEVIVPATLTVIGAPDIALAGQPIAVESAQEYRGSGARTSHALAISTPPAGGGTITLVADGDYGFPGETATAAAEGLALGSVGGFSTFDCTPAQGTFPLTASDLAGLVADGVVNVEVQNSFFVDDFCTVNQHTVRLAYNGPADHLDFGPLFVGLSRDLSLVITNQGTDTLHVGSIATDRPGFVPSFPSLTLPPRTSQTLTVTFTPPSVAVFNGTLTIESDDPDTPLLSIPLTGAGLEPPVMGVSPPLLQSTLFAGAQETQTLTISNAGGSPLDFTVSLSAPAGRILSSPFMGLSSESAGTSNNPPPARDDSGTPPQRGGGRRGNPEDPPDPPGAASGTHSFLGVPGDFDRLRSSPYALTCVVEDRGAGFLYAQTNSGTGFTRYVSATDTWETLASAPIYSGNNGGAALLNGKIYTAYTGTFNALGVYDIASNSWSTIGNPLGSGTGNIASDGTQFLYLVVGSSFKKLDPLTSAATPLAAPPFSFEPWGGLRYLNGVLYGHQGNGARGFASYDIAANRWSLLPSLPGGGVLGGAIDPFKREYFAYGSYGGANLYRYSIDTSVWSVSTIPFFYTYDGGMGWLPFPVAGVYLVEGESGTGFARLITDAGFLRLNPTSGTVPPSGSLAVSATFDAANLLGGTYRADVLVNSNDPITPQLSVPATLTVIGVPDIEIRGETVTLASTVDYFISGARTSHTLPISLPPAGNGSFTLIADGDFGGFLRTAAATAEGIPIGTVGSAPSSCTQVSGTFPVSASALAALAADGAVHVDVQNSPGVSPFCSVNKHTVSLVYESASDHLDFGTLFIGASRSLGFVLANKGTDTLHVVSISSSLPEFTPSVASLDLAPGASQSISVTFRPAGATVLAGTLTITSDDPDTPFASIALAGIGLEAPVAGVQPPSLTSAIPAGDTETQTLTISNTGGSPLDYDVSLRRRSVTTAGNAPEASCDVTKVWVSEAVAGRLASVDLRTLQISRLPTTLNFPDLGLVVNPSADTAFVVESSGDIKAVTLATGDAAIVAPGLNTPLGLALDAAGTTIYVAEYTAGRIARVDIPTGRVDRIASGLAGPTGLALSPTGGTLFVAEFNAGRLTSIDLHSGTRSILAVGLFGPYGLALDSTGSELFVTEFYVDRLTRVEVASGHVSTVAAGLSEPIGLSIDSLDTRVFVAEFGAGNLTEVDLMTGAVIPLVAGLSGPTGVAASVPSACRLGFLRVDPLSGTVAAHSSSDINATFDATTLPVGTYAADIEIRSNDPATPLLVVPTSLTIRGVPNMSISTAPVTISSSRAFSIPGATTSHILPVIGAPAGGGTLDLSADGNFQSAVQSASVSVEGIPAGGVGGTGSACGRASGTFTIAAGDLASFAADGVVTMEVQNSSSVGAACPLNLHSVRLTYPIASDHLDFGGQLIGTSRSFTLNIANIGSETLHITSIATDRPEFTVSAGAVDIPPKTARTLVVTFMPPRADLFSGLLTLESDDLRTPHLAIPLSGNSVEPPVIGVQPASMQSVLAAGAVDTQTLTMSNTGSGPLHFALNIATASHSAFVSVSPITGTVPPSGSVTAGVLFDARSLPIGLYTGSIDVYSDDPATPLVSVPVTLHIAGVPAIALSTGTLTVESSASYFLTGGHTDHAFVIPSPPAGNGSLDLIAEGDFALSVQTATATAEGLPIGSVGGSGSACGTASGTFPIRASRLASLAADGVVHVTVQNSASVGNACAPNRHTVRLRYHQPLVDLEYGPVFIGGSSSLSFFVENAGDDTLNIASIASDSPNFSVSSPALTLPPAATVTLTVTYAPSSEGAETGVLTFLSDDPARPQVTLPMAGRGIRPPIVGVSPAGLSSVLRPPDQETRSLTITNSGGIPLSFSITVRPPVFVSIFPSAGTVPPTGAVPVNVVFDTASQPPGPHATIIDVASDDPLTPVVSVTASLYVLGSPVITVAGDPITLQMVRTYTAAGARTTHRFSLSMPPAGGADIDLTAEGDYGDADETVTASAEGLRSVTAGGVGGDCAAATGHLPLSAAELNSLIGDSILRVDVQNTPQVEASCPANRHTVRVTYKPVLEQVDFDPTFAGATSSRSLFLENAGTDFLEVASIASDLPEFTAVPSSVTLPPGGSASVAVQFAPSAATDYFGALFIESSDPVNPEIAINLNGTGLPAPILGVLPTALSSALVTGLNETQTLMISNPGGSDLTFSAAARSTAPAPFATVSPAAGTVLPGGSIGLAVRIDTAGLPPGGYTAALDITSNDPRAPSFTVPVSLTVIGIPDISLAGDPVSVESTLPYSTPGALTVHHLAIPSPPASAGSVTVTAEGNYGGPSATATATAEGILLGTVGAVGTDCSAASETFPIGGANLAAAAADGAVEVAVQNSPSVAAACPLNAHTIRLTYRKRADIIDFGLAFAGYGTGRSLLIENRGSAPLAVTSITTDRPEFTVAAGALALLPGESATLAVTLTPAAAGPLGPMSGSLRIDSDDPDMPSITVDLAGTAVMPPVAGVSPATLTAALPPLRSTTRSLRVANTGGSDLVWSLGSQGPGGETPLPSWISAAPAGSTIPGGGFIDIAVTLDDGLLPDGDHAQTISVYSNDPAHGRLDVSVHLHVGEVALSYLLVEPATLNLSSNGRTVRASLQLPPAYDPHNVLLSSVLLNGLLAPNTSPLSYADENGDGVEELILKFDRAAFEAIIPEGQSVPVTLTGEVRDETWFRGAAAIRAIRPHVTAPDGGEYFVAGQPVTIGWSAAPAPGSVSYTVILSRDEGSTWETIASSLQTLSHDWTASGAATSQARIRVLAADSAGVMGYDTSDADFTIAGALYPPHGVSTLKVEPAAGGALLFTWSRPGVDAAHGPPSHYRVLRAASPTGAFVEIGAPAAESFTEAASAGAGVVCYKVVAVNVAGESSD